MRFQSGWFGFVVVLALTTAGIDAQEPVDQVIVESTGEMHCCNQCNVCDSACNASSDCRSCRSRARGQDCGCDCGDRQCRKPGCRHRNRQVNVGRSYFEEGDCNVSCFDDCTSNDRCCRRGPFYVSGFGGLSTIDNFYRKLEIDEGDPDVTTFLKIGPTLQDGLATGLSIGRYVHPQGRTELEFTYRDNGVGDFFRQRIEDNVVAFQTIEGADGNVKSYSGMVNVLFDFQQRQVKCAQLYAGGGVGVLYVDGAFSTDGVAMGPMIAEPIDFEVNDSGFAYQGIVGVNYAFRPRIDVYSEFRYLGSQSISVQDTTNNLAYGNFQVDTYSIFVGVRLYR